VDWIQLAQDRDRLRGVVNAVMNLRVKTNVLGLRNVNFSCNIQTQTVCIGYIE
jgi:hypothetical protein